MEFFDSFFLVHGLVAAACWLAAGAGILASWSLRAQRPGRGVAWERWLTIGALAGMGAWILLSAGQFGSPVVLTVFSVLLVACAGLLAAQWIGLTGTAAEAPPEGPLEKLREELLLREAAEQHLRTALADYRRSAADFEQFAYAASHDLQTPLRNIEGFARLLEQRHSTGLDADARMYLQYLTQGVQQMQQLVDALLQLSRIGRREARIEERPLDEALQQARQQLADEITRLDAEIIAPDLPVLPADHALLAQLFQNLIGNALKFQPPGQRPRVTIRSRRQNDDWHLTVTDNGIGIPAEQIDHVFAPFRRLHSQDEFAGTGMGLAICRKIAAHHDGEIWAEPHVGGAQIHVVLPVRTRLATRGADGQAG
ncbi:MAG: sensor histidine kinase [Solimonas sp.]